MVDLSPDAFDGFLDKIGQQFAWRRASACPCVNPDSGAADPQCGVCLGKGRIWDREVIGTAGMTNQTQQKGFAMFGTWEPGDAVLTIGSDTPMYDCGQYDRFRALNSKQRFSQSMTRGNRDYLLGTIVSITRVFWLNDDKTAIIEGGIPKVNQNGTLDWGTVTAPPVGTMFSISGVKFDEYFIYMQLPTNRMHQSGSELPKKLPVRKFDLFGR